MSMDPRFSGQPAPFAEPVTRLRLLRGRTIALEARDPEGRPVAGALLRGFGGQAVALTGDDGRVQMAGDGLPLAPGVAMTLEGPAGSSWANITARQLRGGPARVTLALVTVVAGELIDASSHQPIPGGLVWSASAGLPPATSSPAGPDGRFRLPMPAGSSMQLNAAAPGYLAATATVRRSPGQTAPVRIELTRAAALNGEIVDRSGTPVAGAEVTAGETALGRGLLGTVAADRNGRFRIPSLAAGVPYYLCTRAPGFAPALMVAHAPAASVPAPAAAPPPAPAKPLRISLEPGSIVAGKVADVAGRPLPGIRLELMPTVGSSSWTLPWCGEEARRTVRSGRSGAFAIDHLAANGYRLRATGPGLAPLTRQHIEVSTRTARVDLGTLTLQPGGVLDAQVVDSRGAPIPAASAMLSASDNQPSLDLEDQLPSQAVTGPDGKVRFAGLVPDVRYDLAIHPSEYPETTVNGIAIPTAGPLRIEVQDGHRLTGRVVGADGQPIAGAAVGVIRTMRLESLAQVFPSGAETDAKGEFSLSGLTPGTVQLAATADGFRSSRAVAQIPDSEPARPVEITLEPAGWLVGTVRDTAGNPVSAQVSVMPRAVSSSPGLAQLERFRMGVTEAAGEYRVEGLDPGTYTVSAAPIERTGSVKPSPPIEIQPGENTLDLVVELAKTWEVSGQVVDNAGNPVDGASLQLSPRQAAGTSTATASLADGSFVFADVADGTYTPAARRHGYLMTADAAPVTVTGGPVSGLRLTLSRTEAMISGRLLHLAPAEMAGLRIEAKRTGPDEYELAERNGWPVEAGGSAVDPSSGSYQITDLAAGHWIVTATAAAGRHAGGQVDLEADGAMAVLDLDFAGGAILSGQVTMADRPVAGAVVALVSKADAAAGTAPARTETAADGTFASPSLPLGTIELAIVDLPLGVLYRRTVELTGDQTIAISLPSGAVHGTVAASATGLPIAGAYVVLARSEMPLGALAGSPAAQTDDSGAFDFAPIAPGKYQVTVTRAGFTPGQGTVDVAAEGTATIAMQLDPSSTGPTEPTGPAGPAGAAGPAEPAGPPAEPVPPRPGGGP
jgi:Carboxypeptidase regulatory-like domain